MTPRLTAQGYAGTKKKLAEMEARLAALRARDDLSPVHKGEAERSYIDMIRQYKREIKLYELGHRKGDAEVDNTSPQGHESDRPLTSTSLATLIVDALVSSGVVEKTDFDKAVAIVSEELEGCRTVRDS